MAKISIIIPVYNSVNFLSECLDSLLNQTYQDLEIICVNDGSTDGSLELLNKYAQKDSRVKIIDKEHEGCSAARNKGLEVATGEFVTFIDSDDYLDKNTYEEALSVIENVDIVCFGIRTFGNERTKQKISDDKYYKIKYTGTCKLNDENRFNTDCSVCNKIFKRELIEKYKIRFPFGIHYEDAEFYFKYINIANSAYFIPKYFYHYRRKENSIMSKTFEKCDYAIEHLYIVEHLYDFLRENNLWEAREELFARTFAAYFYFAYRYSIETRLQEIFLLGKDYANKFNISEKHINDTIYRLKNGTFNNLSKPHCTFLERILSLKNSLTGSHKIITICGISIKIKRSKSNAKG